MLVVEERAVQAEVAGFGLSMRLAESFALIWKTTRISNSVSALRLMQRFTLLKVSLVAMMWMPSRLPSVMISVQLRAGTALPRRPSRN